MRPRRRTSVAVAIVLSTVGAAVIATRAALAEPVAPPPITPAHTVRLNTGDLVTLRPGPTGEPTAAVTPAHPGAIFTSFAVGARHYVVPASVLPDLGTMQDLSSFDVTPSAVDAPRPTFAMRTLTVHGVDAAGSPVNGNLLVIQSVDDARIGATATWHHGVARVSVPVGHYMASAEFGTCTRTACTDRIVVLPQFTVAGDREITVDARTATTRVSIAAPQPTVEMVSGLMFGRTDGRGVTATMTIAGTGTNTSGGITPSTFYVAPTTGPVTIGALHYSVNARLFAPPGTAKPYTYDLEFATDGQIPRHQQYLARQQDLATVDASYPVQTGTDQRALDTRIGILPWLYEGFYIATDLPMATPMRRVEYYTARPDVLWRTDHFAVLGEDERLVAEIQNDFRRFVPGTRSATTWGGSPSHPRLLTTPVWTRTTTICPACAAGGWGHVLAFPYSDNDSEHYGLPSGASPGYVESGDYQVYADDVRIASGDYLNTDLRLPASAATYRFDQHTTRRSPALALSTDVRTEWSVPARAPRAPLPAGWVCGDQPSAPSDCGVLPLMTTSYDLPLDLHSALRPGGQTAVVHVDHLGGATVGSTVRLELSYDGGRTWQAAVVRNLGAGTYRASFAVPNGATAGAVRVSARDAYGGTFTETIQRAFAVSG